MTNEVVEDLIWKVIGRSNPLRVPDGTGELILTLHDDRLWSPVRIAETLRLSPAYVRRTLCMHYNARRLAAELSATMVAEPDRLKVWRPAA